MKIRNYYIAIFGFCLLTSSANAQIARDQDLVTLKNGYQVLGYIIEQQPGKLIRIYRPELNDTIETRMEDISKLNKIWVETFSEKTVETEETADTIETIDFGRYNNKKHVVLASYVWQVLDIEARERKGVGLGYFHNFHNRVWAGLSTYYFRPQDPRPIYSDLNFNDTDHRMQQLQIMLESKFRLAFRPQNRRFTTLLAANVGYVVDNSHTWYSPTTKELDVEYQESTDGLMFQTGLTFRINPDNNSGFILEPGYTFYPEVIKQYSAHPDSPDGVYLGFKRQLNHLFTFKLGYFF